MRLNKLNPRNPLAFSRFLISENGYTTREQLCLYELRNPTTGLEEFCHVVIRIGVGQHRDVNRTADRGKPSSSGHDEYSD